MERFFDIIFSFLAMILLFPLIIFFIFILKFSSEGEIFYFQERVGKDGKVFKICKFATMLKDSPNLGTGTITIRNDPRIFPFGKFLRKTKLNELPQIFNIFIGDMSFIGPRPLTSENFNFYSLETQKVLIKVRPGLSGIGSIIFRNEEEILFGKNATTDFYENEIIPYKGSLEKWFVRNKNIRIYFLLMFLTIWFVLSPSSKINQELFKELPEPKENLKKYLHFSK